MNQLFTPGRIRRPVAQMNQGRGPMPAASIQLPQQVEDYYIYATNPVNLAAGATSNQNFQIQSDSNFEWVETTFFANLHSGTEPYSDQVQIPVFATVADSGSGRQLFFTPIPITAMAGVGKQPFILPVARTFQARANVQVTLQSFDATNQWDSIQLIFHGRKIFNMTPQQLRG